MRNFDKVATPAERIKEALQLRGMKQAELAASSGISKPSISCYISGKYEPKQSALYNIGKVLDISEMWLAGYDVPIERPKEQKNNDTLADIVVRMRTEERFFDAVKMLNSLDEDKLNATIQLLKTFAE